MQPNSIAKREIWTIPAESRRSATDPKRQSSPHRFPFRDEQLTVLDRPLRAAEWDMVRAFVGRLEREDLRLRFGHPFDSQDEATLRRFFDIKAGVGEIVGVLDETGAIAGLAHRILVSRAEAEIALLVRSDLQRRGIGEFLLRKTLARSAGQGLRTLNALVLWENRAALRLAAKIGYVPREVTGWAMELTFVIDATAAAT